MGLDTGEVHLGRWGHKAERPGAANVLGPVCCRDEGLGGHAADVEAIPAHLVTLDQHDRHAEHRRRRRHGQAARTGPDHTQIRPQNISHGGFRSVRTSVSRNPRRMPSQAASRPGCRLVRPSAKTGCAACAAPHLAVLSVLIPVLFGACFRAAGRAAAWLTWLAPSVISRPKSGARRSVSALLFAISCEWAGLQRFATRHPPRPS